MPVELDSIVSSDISLPDFSSNKMLQKPLGPMPPAAKKKFKHDCTECQYLGSYEGESSFRDTLDGFGLTLCVSRYNHTLSLAEVYCDCYYCLKTGSYVARYGDECLQYTSMDGVLLEGIDSRRIIDDPYLSILYDVCAVRESKYNNKEFAILTNKDMVRICINPLLDPRRIRYIEDAVRIVGAEFVYEVLGENTVVDLMNRIAHIVQYQTSINR